MDQRLTELLQASFPDILSNMNKPITESCMGWGIECGDGWFCILFSLMLDLDVIAKQHNIQIKADQIKEKFGGLRFYYSTEKNKITTLDKATYTLHQKLNKTKCLLFSIGYGKAYNNIVDIRRKIYQSTYEKIDSLVHQTEQKSYTVCEVCGKPGRIRNKYWVRTMCDACDSDYCTEIEKRGY
jgi:hypothetical protein